MKALRTIRVICVYAAWLLTSSCEKEVTDNLTSFVSFVNTDTDYFTRSCFQLTDGSYVIVGTGEHHAVMARFSVTGDLIWQKELPGTLFGVKKGVPLPSEGFALAGSDSTDRPQSLNSGITTIAIYDNNGNEVRTTSFQIPSFFGFSLLDFIVLKNGHLGFCLHPIKANLLNYPRLLILDQNLTTIVDKEFSDSTGAPLDSLDKPHILEGKDGSIFFSFRVNAGTYNSAGLMKINTNDYSIDYFNERVGQGHSEIPGENFVMDEAGNFIVASAQPENPAPTNLISYYQGEGFSLGKKASLLRVDAFGNYISRHDFTGFSALGSLMKVIRTRDGGFIIVGTSNQDESFTFASNTQLFLIKTDSNLNKQWMRQINTTYPGVGYDVFETKDGGYVIGAFEKSFNKNFKMMVIKTDEAGN